MDNYCLWKGFVPVLIFALPHNPKINLILEFIIRLDNKLYLFGNMEYL